MTDLINLLAFVFVLMIEQSSGQLTYDTSPSQNTTMSSTPTETSENDHNGEFGRLTMSALVVISAPSIVGISVIFYVVRKSYQDAATKKNKKNSSNTPTANAKSNVEEGEGEGQEIEMSNEVSRDKVLDVTVMPTKDFSSASSLYLKTFREWMIDHTTATTATSATTTSYTTLSSESMKFDAMNCFYYHVSDLISPFSAVCCV